MPLKRSLIERRKEESSVAILVVSIPFGLHLEVMLIVENSQACGERVS
jgi:hypothetical protein